MKFILQYSGPDGNSTTSYPSHKEAYDGMSKEFSKKLNQINNDPAEKKEGTMHFTFNRNSKTLDFGEGRIYSWTIVRQSDNPNNPFEIPDLTVMYEAVRDYVAEHQGPKGFILTDDQNYDTIWTIVYEPKYNEGREYEVKAVRVDRYYHLQIVFDLSSVTYNDEAVAALDDNKWYDVRYDDNVYYNHTIFNIAEYIREYVKENPEK